MQLIFAHLPRFLNGIAFEHQQVPTNGYLCCRHSICEFISSHLFGKKGDSAGKNRYRIESFSSYTFRCLQRNASLTGTVLDFRAKSVWVTIQNVSAAKHGSFSFIPFTYTNWPIIGFHLMSDSNSVVTLSKDAARYKSRNKIDVFTLLASIASVMRNPLSVDHKTFT